jgi:hypothetical protein
VTAYRINKIIAPVLLAIVIGMTASWGAEPKVGLSVSVDKTEMTIGDLVILTVSVRYPKGVNVKIPPLGEKLGEFFIRDISLPPPRAEKTDLVQEARYTITTYIVGDVTIPPVTVTYTYQDDTGKTVEKQLQTDPVTIPVKRTAPKDAQDIKDIKGPVAVPFNWRPYLLWGGVGLAAVALIFAAVYYLKKMRPAAILQAKLKPPEPPHEVALRELARIEAMNLIEAGEIDRYYDLVTDVLRNYIGARYSFNAIDMTTDEVVASLIGRLRRLDLKDNIAIMLRESDLVKFAREQSDSDKAHELIEGTRRVVRETTPTASQTVVEN